MNQHNISVTMAELIGNFKWRFPALGFDLVQGVYEQPAGRFSRGGVTFQSATGLMENDLEFDDEPTVWLVPRLADNEVLPSGLDYDLIEDQLAYVLSGTDAYEYAPIQGFPALFREFAATPYSHEQVLSFANQWGALGTETTCYVSLLNDDGSKPEIPRRLWGEAVGFWRFEIGSMFDAVSIWEAITNGRTDFLSNLIWEDGGTAYWRSVESGPGFYGEQIFASADYRPERLPEIENHGILRAGGYVIQDLINRGMKGRVHEQVEWLDDSSGLSIRFMPMNLIGALWLQFADAVRAGHKYDQCRVCSSWFEVAPRSGRPDKKYCSDACKMRAYRQRKLKNQRLS